MKDQFDWASRARSVCLVDPAGRVSTPAALALLGVSAPRSNTEGPEVPTERTSGEEIAASQADVQWTNPSTHGQAPATTPAGRLTVLSVVRGPWEVRAVRVEDPAPAAIALRVGAGAVTGTEITSTTSSETADGYASVRTDGVVSTIQAVSAPATGDVRFQDDAAGTPAAVPFLDFPVRTGGWVTMLITMSAEVSPGSGGNARVTTDIRRTDGDFHALVVWPDGVTTKSVLRATAPPGSVPTQPTTMVPPGTDHKGDNK